MRFPVFSAALLLAACQHQPCHSEQDRGSFLLKNAVKGWSEINHTTRFNLQGRWLGESQSENGERVQWLINRKPDGTFRSQFRHFYENGRSREQIESGFWGVSGGVYFTITRAFEKNGESVPAPLSSAEFNDAYEIKELSETEFVYRALSGGHFFKVKRVADDFTW